MWQPGGPAGRFLAGRGPSFSGRHGDSGLKQRGDFQRDSLWQLCGICSAHDLILLAVTVRIRKTELRQGRLQRFTQGKFLVSSTLWHDAACWTLTAPLGV